MNLNNIERKASKIFANRSSDYYYSDNEFSDGDSEDSDIVSVKNHSRIRKYNIISYNIKYSFNYVLWNSKPVEKHDYHLLVSVV